MLASLRPRRREVDWRLFRYFFRVDVELYFFDGREVVAHRVEHAVERLRGFVFAELLYRALEGRRQVDVEPFAALEDVRHGDGGVHRLRLLEAVYVHRQNLLHVVLARRAGLELYGARLEGLAVRHVYAVLRVRRRGLLLRRGLGDFRAASVDAADAFAALLVRPCEEVVGRDVAAGEEYDDERYPREDADDFRRARALLFDYCRYTRSGAGDLFETNYQSQLIALQIREAKYDGQSENNVS